MATPSPHIPAINSTRLTSTIHATSAWGTGARYGPGPNDTGMARLALSPADALARRWFVEETTRLGCTVTVDQMGNIFAVRKGKRAGTPTAIGSHLDTQPSGGRYDGVLGVTAGVEALRTIVEAGMDTEYAIAVVNWTNEEGARFPKSICASGVWAGVIPLADAWALKEVGGGNATQKEELERIGFMGETACSFKTMPLAAHFELHIEQGPHLESTARKIGVVMGAQAYRWYTLTLTGREAHTGTTPFSARADALLCGAKVIVESNAVAKAHKGLITTGIITAHPGSTNTICGRVVLSLDLRHVRDGEGGMEGMDAALREAVTRVAREEGVRVEWRRDTDAAVTRFDAECVGCVRESAEAVVGREKAMEIMSGAGHDSCMTALRCPTAMVFVPSKDGVSHNPVEYTSPEDCGLGAQVLLGAVLRYDQLRVKQEGKE